MMAARFGEFHLTAERTVFMDNKRIEGGREGETQAHRGGVGGSGGCGGLQNGEGKKRGALSHLGTLQEEKINFQTHTHTHRRTDSLGRSMTFKRKKLTLTPSLSPRLP